MSTDPYIGSMGTFGGAFTIRNFAMCLGQTMAISQNQALFALIGTIYGGDARTTYALPDLRGRSPVGSGVRPGGMDYRQGERQGTELVGIEIIHMPAHSHTAIFTPLGGANPVSGTMQVATNAANTTTPDSDSYIAQSSNAAFFKPTFGQATLTDIKGLTVSGGGSAGGTVTVTNTGGSAPLNILNPVLPVNWLIATEGVFPPRN
ncbi:MULTISPECIES: tail fiber protein [unclassified Pseudoalteromonas]|uniref:phage tail protein n=1 Tax=unclassified Pseudoalteromonas TaxID=194690 RepID=UPI002097D160|nr:tail fiber protein [Pseudoalteromonas sp. XMcav2-N]MCO7188990.1 tail fiber protein [Pseudoalteromonas sp. XMcav2-N]